MPERARPDCPRGGGSGTVGQYAHACGGDEARCYRVCPIEIEAPCSCTAAEEADDADACC
jgi:hypothetical protein